jgi:hypothetical protein
MAPAVYDVMAGAAGGFIDKDKTVHFWLVNKWAKCHPGLG